MSKIKNIITNLIMYCRKPKFLIITHKDTDGIACASILIRYIKQKLFENKFMVIFSGPANLSKLLSSLRVKNKRIFICDISPNINEENTISEALTKLYENGNTIEWIDHHNWRRKFISKISSRVSKLIVDEAPSAAKLIFHEYMSDDEISRKIMEYADDADMLGDNFKETIAFRILLFVDSKWRKHLLSMFVQGRFWDREVEESFKHHIQKINSIIQKIIHEVKVMETSTGKKFTLINLRGIRYPKSWIAGKIAEKLNLDFTIVVRKINAISLYCSKNSRVNLLPIALHYGGGGHTYACGFRIKLSIKSLIKSLIFGRKHIPEEVWEIVEKVKNEV